MDEVSVLKYIFRGEFREDTGIVTFNNRKYNYNEFLENSAIEGTFFSFIYRKEEEVTEHKTEYTPQIDANMIDVQKITEEQFYEWKKSQVIKEGNGKVTGKMIWMEKKREGIQESMQEF